MIGVDTCILRTFQLHPQPLEIPHRHQSLKDIFFEWHQPHMMAMVYDCFYPKFLPSGPTPTLCGRTPTCIDLEHRKNCMNN